MSFRYTNRTSTSIDSPTPDGHPSLRELHNLTVYSPIDSIPLPSQPPLPIRPVLPKRTSTSCIRSSASGSNSTVSSNPKNARYPIGTRMMKTRRLLDDVDFYVAGLHGARDEPKIKQKFVPRIRETMEVILDYMELNLRDQRKLPEFPSEFHDKIAELSMTAFVKFNMRIDTFKMYTIIHEAVKLMPQCGDTPFRHFSPFPPEILDDKETFEQALRCVISSDVKELITEKKK